MLGPGQPVQPQPWSGTAPATGSGGVAVLTAATATVIAAVTAISDVEGRGIACASRAQTHVSAYCAGVIGSTSQDADMCAGGRGHTFARVVASGRSCRSGRPSKPTGEGGAHPRDGKGRTLLSAPPLGSSATQLGNKSGAVRSNKWQGCDAERTLTSIFWNVLPFAASGRSMATWHLHRIRLSLASAG